MIPSWSASVSPPKIAAPDAIAIASSTVGLSCLSPVTTDPKISAPVIVNRSSNDRENLRTVHLERLIVGAFEIRIDPRGYMLARRCVVLVTPMPGDDPATAPLNIGRGLRL